MRMYKVILSLSEKKNAGRAADLRNVSKNFGDEIPNNPNSVKTCLKNVFLRISYA
jgi:hypothetical protein